MVSRPTTLNARACAQQGGDEHARGRARRTEGAPEAQSNGQGTRRARGSPGSLRRARGSRRGLQAIVAGGEKPRQTSLDQLPAEGSPQRVDLGSGPPCALFQLPAGWPGSQIHKSGPAQTWVVPPSAEVAHRARSLSSRRLTDSLLLRTVSDNKQ